MQAATEFSAAGAWQDAASVSDDARPDKVILDIEHGEIAEDLSARASCAAYA